MMRSAFFIVAAMAATRFASAAVPEQFFANYCVDCHDSTTQKAEIDLEALPEDWAKHSTVEAWERVLRAIEGGEMPPKKKTQPEAKERGEAVAALRAMLAEKSPVGGSTLQRLNRVQYEQTIQQLFGLPFRLPTAFPTDTPEHGFDTVAEGLVLSGPLMEQYLEVATAVADEIIAPPAQQGQVEPKVLELKPADFSTSFEGSKLHGEGADQRLRLVSKHDELIRSSTWATRFDAKQTGEYEINLRLAAYKPKGEEPLKAHLLAVESGSTFVSVKTLRQIGEFEVPAAGGSRDFSVRATLNRGETIAVYWANSLFGYAKGGGKERVRQFHERLSDRKLYAAWLKLGWQRGRIPGESWRQLKELMDSGTLDLKDPRLDSPPTQFSVDQNAIRDIFECMHHDIGPGLDLLAATVRGPVRIVEDEADRARAQRTAKFLGERAGRTDAVWCSDVLRPFLTQTFRRPVSDEKLEKFTRLALEHIAAGHRFEDAMHLAIRAALTSPDFLYLATKPGRLDDFDLATRLSYFLTSSPPDELLMQCAGSGKLSDPKVLEAETRRLLAQPGNSSDFVTQFTGQWLGTRLLPEIMPDPRLLKFGPQDMDAMIAETETFFAEILHQNLPLKTFIAPDFTFMNERLAKNIYQFEMPSGGDKKSGKRDPDGDKKSGKSDRDGMRRVSLPPEGRIGGILGQASVMMATANGVDTQPVLRGVWLLENVFGTPPPPAPKNVPAIPPNTTGAKTIRELLTAHKADASCASCHTKIDPPGFALENFDPVGRWREFYPIFKERPNGNTITSDGAPVDATGTMPDGTPIKDVTDLKRYLLQHPDLFARCLTGKLLTYATGRPMSYGDKQDIERIIADVKPRGNGFMDLIITLVKSEAFQSR